MGGSELCRRSRHYRVQAAQRACRTLHDIPRSKVSPRLPFYDLKPTGLTTRVNGDTAYAMEYVKKVTGKEHHLQHD
jgi:hypothetical protein